MTAADLNLDTWLGEPTLRVSHRRESSAEPERLWEAARAVRLADTHMLGRLVRWRIPGVAAETRFDELFRNPPFAVLQEEDQALVSGLVGRIWTLRRDYPRLGSAEEFRGWSTRGTARVLFASWVEPGATKPAALLSEVRVKVFGAQGRIGLAAVRPLISAFNNLVATDGIEAALRRAEGRAAQRKPRGR
jgi:hypothetical protein